MLHTINPLPTTVLRLHLPLVSLTPLTGLLQVVSPLFKTRVSVVHAGLSPLASPLKVLTSLLQESSFSFLSSKLLVAP